MVFVVGEKIIIQAGKTCQQMFRRGAARVLACQ